MLMPDKRLIYGSRGPIGPIGPIGPMGHMGPYGPIWAIGHMCPYGSFPGRTTHFKRLNRGPTTPQYQRGGAQRHNIGMVRKRSIAHAPALFRHLDSQRIYRARSHQQQPTQHEGCCCCSCCCCCWCCWCCCLGPSWPMGSQAWAHHGPWGAQAWAHHGQWGCLKNCLDHFHIFSVQSAIYGHNWKDLVESFPMNPLPSIAELTASSYDNFLALNTVF